MAFLNGQMRQRVDRTIVTPALEGKRNHETLYGATARSAHHWKLLALVLLGLVVWDRIQFNFLLAEKQYVPVVIAEHEDGSTRFVGEPDPTWKPSDRNILDDLKWAVQTLRGRTTDAQFDQRLWKRLYEHATEKGRTQMGPAYKELDSAEEKGRIIVDVVSINKGSDHSFDVRWTERRHDISNGLVSITRWRGLFTVLVDVPRTLSGLGLNEKGVWIDGWNIAKEEQ